MSIFRFLLCMTVFLLGACTQNPDTVTHGEVVNLYTNCFQKTDDQLFSQFEEATGIKVNILGGSNTTEQALAQLSDSDHPHPDLFLLKGLNQLSAARQNNLLQPFPHEVESAFPSKFRELSWWHVLTYDPIVVAYARDSVNTPIPLNNYLALGEERFSGKLIISSTPWLLPTLTGCLLRSQGAQATEQWLGSIQRALLADGITQSPVKRLTTDSAKISLISMQEYATTPMPPDIAIAPLNQAGNGAFAIISAIAVGKNAPNPEYAQRLISFLLSSGVQQAYAATHWEYPARKNVAATPKLADLDSLKINQQIVTSDSIAWNTVDSLIDQFLLPQETIEPTAPSLQ